MVSVQTAASFWNYDFMHRDVYLLKVVDRSYGKALESFAQSRGWKIHVEIVNKTDLEYTKVDGLLVETIEKTVVECIQNWAFVDAFASLYTNKERLRLKQILKKAYWKRISGSDVRVRQALEYGCYLIDKSTGQKIFNAKESWLNDDYIKREIDEAVEKVVSLA